MSITSRLLLVSLAESAALTRLAPQYAPFSSFFWNFAVLFVFQLFSFLLYDCILYPYFLTPLRELPEPKVRYDFLVEPLLCTDTRRATIGSLVNFSISPERKVGHRCVDGFAKFQTMA